MGDPRLAKLADSLAFYLRQTDMALCMVRHFVSLGLWKLDTAASEADIQAHVTEIESCSDYRSWAAYQHHRCFSTQQKSNANIIVDVDRRSIYDVAEELQVHVQQILLSSTRMIFKAKGATPSQEGPTPPCRRSSPQSFSTHAAVYLSGSVAHGHRCRCRHEKRRKGHG